MLQNDRMKTCDYMMLCKGVDRNWKAGLHRLLRGQAHGHGPTPIDGTTREISGLADRADHHCHFIFKLEDFTGDLLDLDLLNLFAIERPERKRRVKRAVHGPAPSGPKGALGAGNFYGLVMFERCERLRNNGVAAARKMHDRAKIV